MYKFTHIYLFNIFHGERSSLEKKNKKQKRKITRVYFEAVAPCELSSFPTRRETKKKKITIKFSSLRIWPAHAFISDVGLSFREAERRLKETGPNIPLQYRFPRWWNIFWNALFHPFNIILIVLSTVSYITKDDANGSIMLSLVFISVFLRFYQAYCPY